MNTRPYVLYADPLHAGRHPFQTFIVGLSIGSGIPLVLGHQTANSIEALLPNFMAIGWGVSLCLGALLALVGAYWPRRNDHATALTLERIGLDIVGPAALVYAALILIFAGITGSPAALIVAGFGCAALWRARDIGRVIKRANVIHRGEDSG